MPFMKNKIEAGGLDFPEVHDSITKSFTLYFLLTPSSFTPVLGSAVNKNIFYFKI